MATLAHGAVTSSDAQFRQGFSARLFKETIVENPLNRILTESGCINVENDLTLNKGGRVTLYNAPKINGKGFTGDVDYYANAQQIESTSRTLDIALVSANPLTFPLQGTQSFQNFAPKIDEHKVSQLKDWMMAMYCSSLLNQAGGNTATSITQTTLDSTAFTTSADRLRITGNNATIAPTRWYWASKYDAAVSTDASIQSTNVLTIDDFQFALETLAAQPSAGPAYQPVNNGLMGIVVVGFTGYNQLLNQAKTNGQGLQLSNLIYSEMQGGKDGNSFMGTFTIPGLPFKFVVVPDQWLPRGVNASSGAEVANSRRAIIMGRNALDLAFGQGYAPAGGKVIPGFNVEVDTEHKKLNKMGYAKASLLWGCKKTQTTGSGNGNTTAYDLSTYVITHYSRG